MSPAIIVESGPSPLGNGLGLNIQNLGHDRVQEQPTQQHPHGNHGHSHFTHDPEPSSSDSSDECEARESPNTDLELNLDSINDQDDAQAVMQPAMSAVASHMASAYTPAIEKAAAMDKLPAGGMFDVPFDDNDNPSPFSDTSTCPEQAFPSTTSVTASKMSSATPSQPATHLPPGFRDPLPSPWHSGPKEWIVLDKDAQSRPFKGAMSSVMGSSRQRSRSRSRSMGQETLKKIQKAFPSLSSPSHLLPSLPTGFFSSFSDKSQSQPRPSPTERSISDRPLPKFKSVKTEPPQDRPITQGTRIPQTERDWPAGHHRRVASAKSRPSFASSRPKTLRRATSDESILYQSLSRVSSLGNDEQFNDVRDMVNMRLQAIRESLPDVPTFKMPTMPKINPPSFVAMSMLNLGDDSGPQTPVRSTTRDSDNLCVTPKDGLSTLDQVLANLTGDIVLMGGLRGSILRSAKPPHQQVWAPVKVGLNMRKVNLEIGLEDEDEERVEETIVPSGMLSHMGPVDISRKLFKKLRNCENARTGKLRVWDYGYDWRLSPHILSRKLRDFLSALPSNQPGVPPESQGVMVIAHSMGGLITRHAVNQAPHLFSGVLFAGTPQRCINILGPIRHGDVILFNEKLLSPQVNFTIRSYQVFLPEDGFCFVDKNTREEYPVDFYDPEQWYKWRISPSIQPPLPALSKSPQMITGSPSLSSFTTSLRNRAASQSEKWFSGVFEPTAAAGHKDRTLAPQMNNGFDHSAVVPASDDEMNAGSTLTDRQLKKNMEYLGRTLARTKQFRAECTHQEDQQAANAYPPLAVLYGKSTPTVYAAQVNGREGIGCADAYDDLLFRPGDGVVLAKEAMLPDGYVLVNGGRICTERGHITMLADMHAVGRALCALLRGRKKGIGLGGKARG